MAVSKGELLNLLKGNEQSTARTAHTVAHTRTRARTPADRPVTT